MKSSTRLLPGLILSLAIALAAAAAPPASVPPPQILRIGNGAEPETLDPHRAETVNTSNILRDLYEGLTAFAADGRIVPAAADRWDVSPDQLSYTFHLREGARWSNGDPVVAADFVAGLRRSVDPATESSYSQLLTPIENAQAISEGKLPAERLGVEAPDPQTLRIRLVGPTPYLLGLLAHQAASPIHRPSLQQYGRDFARPGRLVSNGAYRLDEWVVQSRVTLLRNPYYWDNAHTTIDQVIYFPTEDVDSELKRYRAGELDCTYDIPKSQARWVRGLFGAQLHLVPYIGSSWYGYNLRRPPFQGNPKLRQALSMVVDRALIAGKLLQDTVLPAYSLVPPGMADYTPQRPEWADWPYPRRLDEARRLYAEAGYGPGHPLQVELRYNTEEDNRRIAILVAAMWKQYLGVETHLVNEEWKVFLQNRQLKAVTQVFRDAWIADFADAVSFLDTLRSFDGQNNDGYASAAYDASLAQAQQEADPQRRRLLLQQAERILLDDVAILPIYYYESHHLVKPYVAGWQDNALDLHYSKDLRLLPH